MQKLTITDNARLVEDISWQVLKSKKIVIITGAGISTSSGIPDFRSKGGLYQLINKKFPKQKISGEQLFDKSSLKNENTKKIFYTFMGELRNMIDSAAPTKTHRFFKRLADRKKILRYYTQNIDDLEAAIDLDTVQLHGSMAEVRCDVCSHMADFTQVHREIYKKGEPPRCPKCEERDREKQAKGKRRHTIGVLRPNITLYNDVDDSGRGAYVQHCVHADLKKRPDFLLVVGTSLKVHGLKHLVKSIAKSVHDKGGKAVLVNLTDVNKEWNLVFDYHIVAEADAWAESVEQHLGINQVQSTLKPSISKAGRSGKPKKRSNFEDDEGIFGPKVSLAKIRRKRLKVQKDNCGGSTESENVRIKRSKAEEGKDTTIQYSRIDDDFGKVMTITQEKNENHRQKPGTTQRKDGRRALKINPNVTNFT